MSKLTIFGRELKGKKTTTFISLIKRICCNIISTLIYVANPLQMHPLAAQAFPADKVPLTLTVHHCKLKAEDKTWELGTGDETTDTNSLV